MIEKITPMDISISEMGTYVEADINRVGDFTRSVAQDAYVAGYNDAVDAITQKMGESTEEAHFPLDDLTEREKGRQDVWKVVCWISEMSYVDRKEIFGFETLDAIFGEHDGTALTWYYKENHNEIE